MAAAFAGVSGNTLSVSGNTPQERVQAMVNAYARARYAIGLGLQTDLGCQGRLNPLAAPRVLSETTAATGIDLSTAGGYYGLWLAELTSESLRATLSAYQLAQALASEATDLLAVLNADADADNVLNRNDSDATAVVDQAIADFLATDAARVVYAANANVGGGASAFIGLCAPREETRALNDAFTGATSPAANLNPSDAQISQLATEITNQITAQLQGTSFTLQSRAKTAGACN
jgi:membrane protease subunit (stomatin/prohibitin family)